MKVKMISTWAGPEGVRLAGAVYELPETTALHLLNNGFAEPVRERTRTAAIQPPETAIGKAVRGRQKTETNQNAQPKKEAHDVAEISED